MRGVVLDGAFYCTRAVISSMAANRFGRILFFTGEGTANVQKILIAEDALGYKAADRHHGRTKFRDPRRDDIAGTEAVE